MSRKSKEQHWFEI